MEGKRQPDRPANVSTCSSHQSEHNLLGLWEGGKVHQGLHRQQL